MIEEMGNPFMEKTNELLALSTKQIMSLDALARLCKVEEVGMAQYESFIAERFMQQGKYSGTSLIRTPKGQSEVSVLERCPFYRGHEYYVTLKAPLMVLGVF